MRKYQIILKSDEIYLMRSISTIESFPLFYILQKNIECVA